MKFDQLITSLRDLDGSLKRHVSSTANVDLTVRNWLVGGYIVEFEQNGEDRAEYEALYVSYISMCHTFRTRFELPKRPATAYSPNGGVILSERSEEGSRYRPSTARAKFDSHWPASPHDAGAPPRHREILRSTQDDTAGV